MDLSTISDLDIALEHSKREATKLQMGREAATRERLRLTRLVVDRIHEIDKTIPIIIFDPKKHMGWSFNRSDGDSRFDVTVNPWQYGYFKRRDLVPAGGRSEAELIPLMANGFVNTWHSDRRWAGMQNKRNNFYFIFKFCIGLNMGLSGDTYVGGYVTYAYEKRSNLIKFVGTK